MLLEDLDADLAGHIHRAPDMVTTYMLHLPPHLRLSYRSVLKIRVTVLGRTIPNGEQNESRRSDAEDDIYVVSPMTLSTGLIDHRPGPG